jgi:hypothetical protein
MPARRDCSKAPLPSQQPRVACEPGRSKQPGIDIADTRASQPLTTNELQHLFIGRDHRLWKARVVRMALS